MLVDALSKILFNMAMDMLETAHKYIESKRGSWKAFEAETGIPYSWIQKFHQRQIKDPGYSRVKQLYELAQREAWGTSGKTVNQ